MEANELIKKIKDLPTISTVAMQINEEVKKESLTAKSLAALINQDPSLTAKLLKLSNSAYYGLMKQVTTMEKAVTVLGLDTIQSLALTVSIYKVFKSGPQSFDFSGLWLHSLGCGVAAKNLVLAATPSLAEQAFVCGIIHDVGKIAIADQLPEEMAAMLAMISNGMNQKEAEAEIFGFSHQKIGGRIASAWNFPDNYVFAIKSHHNDFPLKQQDDPEATILGQAVLVGNKIAKGLAFGKSSNPGKGKVTREELEFFAVSGKNLAGIVQQIKTDYQQLVDNWQLDAD
jgi:HD-like signal output (HDOD) protein